MTNRIIKKESVLMLRLLFSVAALFILHGAYAFAHSPGAVTPSYNGATQTLKVDITHTSKSPEKHYIKKIELIKNGAVVHTQEYFSQPANDKFSYEYKIPLSDKDNAEVKATCSIFGSKTAKVAVSGKEPQK